MLCGGRATARRCFMSFYGTREVKRRGGAGARGGIKFSRETSQLLRCELGASRHESTSPCLAPDTTRVRRSLIHEKKLIYSSTVAAGASRTRGESSLPHEQCRRTGPCDQARSTSCMSRPRVVARSAAGPSSSAVRACRPAVLTATSTVRTRGIGARAAIHPPVPWRHARASHHIGLAALVCTAIFSATTSPSSRRRRCYIAKRMTHFAPSSGTSRCCGIPSSACVGNSNA